MCWVEWNILIVVKLSLLSVLVNENEVIKLNIIQVIITFNNTWYNRQVATDINSLYQHVTQRIHYWLIVNSDDKLCH